MCDVITCLYGPISHRPIITLECVTGGPVVIRSLYHYHSSGSTLTTLTSVCHKLKMCPDGKAKDSVCVVKPRQRIMISPGPLHTEYQVLNDRVYLSAIDAATREMMVLSFRGPWFVYPPGWDREGQGSSWFTCTCKGQARLINYQAAEA